MSSLGMSRTSTACASISLRLTVLSRSLPSLSCELCPGLIDAENDCDSGYGDGYDDGRGDYESGEHDDDD